MSLGFLTLPVATYTAEMYGDIDSQNRPVWRTLEALAQYASHLIDQSSLQIKVQSLLSSPVDDHFLCDVLLCYIHRSLISASESSVHDEGIGTQTIPL